MTTDIESHLLEYLQQRGWDNLKPADLAKSIMIEGAELLEVFQWNDQTLDEVKQDQAKLDKIKEELADVLIYALEMSILLGLDTKQIIIDKNNKARLKYPAELMKNASQQGRGEVYHQIKQQYRQNKETSHD